MCWITNKEPQCKVAERDITTLKVVEKPRGFDFFYPYYRPEIKYHLNEVTPKVQIEIELNNVGINLKYEIYQGYHSYIQENAWEKPRIRTREDTVYVNGNAYFVGYFNSLCIVECIIPKGVKYYTNEYRECVSEQIIINKILEKFERF